MVPVEISPLHSKCPIVANKRRKLALSPVCDSYSHRRGLGDTDSCQFPTHFHTEDAIANEAKD